MELRVAPSSTVTTPSAGGERVLIVDDDELILKALARILESAGYEPRCFLSPEEALAAMDGEAPVVVISDYMMPTMDGITFLKHARARFPGAVRILCTAAEDFRIALQAVNSGEVFRIISKPWHQQELLATVPGGRGGAAPPRERAADERGAAAERAAARDERAARGDGPGAHAGAPRGAHRRARLPRRRDPVALAARLALRPPPRAGSSGSTEPELTVIEHGALLHDIGKIGVRDGVLLKPGPLTTDEWTEMKRHPELGWALLQRVDYLRPASSIVLQHQEKWDGTGYPRGLRGETIVVGARIFHVVDTLDAITSDRPYRRARPFDEACGEIVRCRGTQFDPRVVDAFLAVPAEDWERIRLDVETVAVLSADLAEVPASAEALAAALDATARA